MAAPRTWMMALGLVALATLAANYEKLFEATEPDRPPATSTSPSRVTANRSNPGKPVKPTISIGDASRFLNQASFGPTEAEAMALTASTYSNWINN